jgi:hypothetical protein
MRAAFTAAPEVVYSPMVPELKFATKICPNALPPTKNPAVQSRITNFMDLSSHLEVMVSEIPLKVNEVLAVSRGQWGA